MNSFGWFCVGEFSSSAFQWKKVTLLRPPLSSPLLPSPPPEERPKQGEQRVLPGQEKVTANLGNTLFDGVYITVT